MLARLGRTVRRMRGCGSHRAAPTATKSWACGSTCSARHSYTRASARLLRVARPVVGEPVEEGVVDDLLGVITPQPDQLAGVEWIMRSLKGQNLKGCILTDDTGVGKALQALLAACRFGVKALVLFLVPEPVVDVWLATAWTLFPGQSVRALFENGLATTEATASSIADGGWLFMTYQHYVQNTAIFGQRSVRARIDLLVCDDAHLIANESERHREVSAAPSEKRLLLTATPVLNDRRMLWSLLDLAHPGSVSDTFERWGWMEWGDHGTADSAAQPEEVATALRELWSAQAQHYVRARTEKYICVRYSSEWRPSVYWTDF
ncbi:P-loop containing nucleoside triphosphate hydrolase protein [Pavlovales sp. CCMP2436]|nr:P-loop containing nucleoside triphosphate hydrolase protein [Pavlovales sp. CCMP2436]